MLSSGMLVSAAILPSSVVTSLASYAPAFERGHARWNNYQVPNNYGHSRWNQFKQVQEWKESLETPSTSPRGGRYFPSQVEPNDLANGSFFAPNEVFPGRNFDRSRNGTGQSNPFFGGSGSGYAPNSPNNPSFEGPSAPILIDGSDGAVFYGVGEGSRYFLTPTSVLLRTDASFTFVDAEGEPGSGWQFLDIGGELDVAESATFYFDFTDVQSLDEAKYYAWQVIEADGGITIDGEQVDGDFVPAEFTGIDGFEDGQFAYWQGENDYFIEYIPDGEQSRYDPAVTGDTSYGVVDTIGYTNFINAVYHEGSGTVDLSGSNTYSNFQTISSGSLNISSIGAVVPEPSTTSLLLLGGFGWLLRRRRE